MPASTFAASLFANSSLICVACRINKPMMLQSLIFNGGDLLLPSTRTNIDIKDEFAKTFALDASVHNVSK